MHTFVKRALWGVVLGGGIAVLGATVANGAETDGSDGLISGTQALISVEVPITVSGTGLSVIGDSVSEGSTAAAPAAPSVSVAPATDGRSGILSGTQALVNVALPVTVGGNAISVLGDSSTTDAATTAAPAGSTGTNTAGATTDGTDGTASGTQVVAPIAAPITVGGNAISVLGDSTSTDATAAIPGGTSGTGGTTTTGDDGTASGTQVVAPIAAPITVGGNAISVAGDSTSDAATTVVPTGNGSAGPVTSGDGALLGGTQVVLPITAPITVGGNAIAVIGDSTTADPVTVPGTDPGGPGTTDGTTDPGTTDPGTTGPGATPGSGPTAGAALTSGVANGAGASVRPLAQTGGTDLTVVLLTALGLISAGLLALFTRRTVRHAAQR